MEEKNIYIIDPRMHWFIILFVRSSEYFVLIVVGKNIFRKEVCARNPVLFFCVNDVLENL